MTAPTPGHTAEPVDPVRTNDMSWIPTGGGKSFRPLRFEPDGAVIGAADSASQRTAYLTWCRQNGIEPAAQILT